jgi:hypothetical protein
MRSVPEPSSVGGRDPWAGFAAGPSSSGSYPAPGSSTGAYGNGSAAGDDQAVADLARRLQDRVDGQEALLDRVALLAQLADDRARIAELHDIGRRLRRDSEALLLLCGADPGVHRGAPHTVSAVLGDAVELADEPSRVAVTAAPSATLASTAAVELRHLVAELVDEAAAASPGARVEVDARLAADGALVVDVVVAGRGWTDALSGTRSGSGGTSRIAERLARRSTGGIRLERPLIDRREGVVATVTCPSALVTGHTGGDPWHLPGSFGGSSYTGSSYAGSSYPAADLGFGDDSPLMSSAMTSALPATPYGRTEPRPDVSSRGGDELFGPLPTSVGVVGTPIFEAVASAWFRDDERGPSTGDWETEGDREWREASARATRTDVPSTTTASGLPRRSPGDRLVPPPRASRPAGPPPDERVPERVRDRLATYQRGLQQGRHRASDGSDASEAWTAESW